MFIIEKNHPIPAINSTKKSYPFESMEVGDSFLFAGDKNAINAIRVAMTAHNRKKTGRRYISRTVENGLRFWRVE